MKFNTLQFDTKDVVKLVGFVGVILSMWYDLKTDFAVHKEEHKFLEYRVEQLEKQNQVTAMTYQSVAIVPNQTKIEDDK